MQRHLEQFVHGLEETGNSTGSFYTRDQAAISERPIITLPFAATSRFSRSAKVSMSISAAVAIPSRSRTKVVYSLEARGRMLWEFHEQVVA
jgi:hypothetical protein